MADVTRGGQARCSFCRKPRNEVPELIEASGEGPFICTNCVGKAAAAIMKKAQQAAADAGKEEVLRKPREIDAFLGQYVIGQEKARRDVAVAVYNHYKRRQAIKQGVDLGVEISKSNIILMGPSGTGKTEIARSIARMLKVPFYVGDATRLTQAGYVGDDVENLLQGLIAAAGDVERAEWGIIFIDEFDKLARKSGRGATGYRDVTGEGVQQALLKLLEGSKVPVPRGMGKLTGEVDMVDTSNILFIGAGSFAGIEEDVAKRVNKDARMGFGASERQKLEGTDMYLQVTEEDVLEFGMIPELVGRMPVLTTTIDLTEDQMVEILTKPKNALVKQQQALFKLDDIELEFDEAALRQIAKEAKTRPTGARALRSIVERVLAPYVYDSPSDPTIQTIRVTEDCVLGKGEAFVVRRQPAVAHG